MHLRQSLLLFTFVGLLFSNCFSQETKPPYRDPNLPAEQRAADLVKRMTLEEKVDQVPTQKKSLKDWASYIARIRR
jgi:hypothetical protein